MPSFNVECHDKFLLYFEFKHFWLQEFSQDPALALATVPSTSAWNESALTTCLLTLRDYLRGPGREHETIGVLDFLVANWDVFCATTPFYSSVWLLDILRLLSKTHSLEAHKAHATISHGIMTLMARLCAFPLAYQFKVLSMILRIWRLCENAIHHPVLPIMERLLGHPACQKMLIEVVADKPVDRSPQETVGLVVLDVAPSVRIFAMRLCVFLAEFLGQYPESAVPLVRPMWMAIPWSPWQYSLAVVSLFNEHEGLIFKGLLRLLSLELTTPALIAPISGVFCSCRLYEDLLLRCDWDANYFRRGLAENNLRMTAYLYRLYSAVGDGLLFEQQVIQDGLEFHVELLDMIHTVPHCVPLVKCLQRALRRD